MKLLPLVTLAIAGAALLGCGTTRDNRFNETAYADHNAGHDVVYRSPAYTSRDYDDGAGTVVYVPAYRAVPVERRHLIYGGDGYYYYTD